MSELIEALRKRALNGNDHPILDQPGATPVSIKDLLETVEERVDWLLRENPQRRPIALQLDHGIAQCVLELAALEADIAVLSLPRFFTPDQTARAVRETGTALVFDSPEPFRARRRKPSSFSLPSATARITYTSGSTGEPKGICLSRDHMMQVARSIVDRLGASHAGRHLALLPPGILLETVAGFFPTLLAGGTYVCPPQGAVGMDNPFRPDFNAMVTAIARHQITSLILVPEYLKGIVDVLAATGQRLPLLTLVAVGGARVPPELVERARVLGLPVRQGYGLTEFGSVVSLEDEDNGKPGSAGIALPHVDVKIADDGEIILSGPQYLGVVGEPEARVPQEEYLTGDIGRIDERGRLWVEGRKSNLIVTSFGRNISPEWLESLLTQQDDIAQAMVYGNGLPAPLALVVPASSDSDVGRAIDAVNRALPAYAQIASWREVPHFTPMNGMLTGNGRLRREAILEYWCSDQLDFYKQLEAATVRDRLRFLAVPQVQAGLSGQITREVYCNYLAQAYHHVRHTVPLMREARARLAHRPELVLALDEYIAEETGHEEWILSDIDVAGGDSQAVRHSAPAPATAAMVEHAYTTIRQGNPVAFFGMVYVLESVSVALASQGASAIAKRLNLPPQAFTYLTSHGALDQDHLVFFANLVNALEREEDREAIVSMARDIFRLFGAMFASIELEEMPSVAA